MLNKNDSIPWYSQTCRHRKTFDVQQSMVLSRMLMIGEKTRQRFQLQLSDLLHVGEVGAEAVVEVELREGKNLWSALGPNPIWMYQTLIMSQWWENLLQPLHHREQNWTKQRQWIMVNGIRRLQQRKGKGRQVAVQRKTKFPRIFVFILHVFIFAIANQNRKWFMGLFCARTDSKLSRTIWKLSRISMMISFLSRKILKAAERRRVLNWSCCQIPCGLVFPHNLPRSWTIVPKNPDNVSIGVVFGTQCRSPPMTPQIPQCHHQLLEV